MSFTTVMIIVVVGVLILFFIVIDLVNAFRIGNYIIFVVADFVLGIML